ncbi:alcohol dehydrogenase catalytic domain-containing protein [Pseudonocardia benzenivorans]|uniref:Alcohol dehydrogenase catalytic domain-containing protein n=1 Tax=Pseudonocardia benzenivorans TaxID=228005 RepID=A0ABW3V8M7_9PSEU
MRAVVYQGARQVSVENVDDPTIEAPTDVVARVRLSSICGSDLYLYRGEAGDLAIPGRTSLGHELAGEVVEVGSNVSRFRVGDRITVPYSISCGTCFFCRAGQTAHCETTGKAIYGFGVGFGDMGGTQAEYVRIPLADAHAEPVPESITDEQALFLSCNLPAAVHAVSEVPVTGSSSVAVLGCGPTGLLAVQLLLRRGPAQLIALDEDPARLQQAEKLGAHPVSTSDGDPVEAVKELTSGRGVDAVVEFVGRGPAFTTAVGITRPGGTISGGGVYLEQDHPVSLFTMYLNNLRIQLNGFSNARTALWDALRLIETSAVDPTALVTHRLPLGDAAEAYRLFDTHDDGALKQVLQVS